MALVVFGPDRLPELARQAGRFVARVRSEAQRSVDELQRVAEIRELREELEGVRRELRSVGGEVTGRVGPRGHGAGGRATRAADDPPPFDPEAT